METYENPYKTYWKISLSDGSTFYEGKAPFEYIKGELSPYQRLLKHLAANKVFITSMALVNGSKTYHLPSLGKTPNFRPFALADRPDNFVFYRAISQDLNTGESEQAAVIEAQYKVGKLQVWVDENGNCWTLFTCEK